MKPLLCWLSAGAALLAASSAARAQDVPGPQSYKTIAPYSFWANPTPNAGPWQPVLFLHPLAPSIASGACGASTNGSISGVDAAGEITIGSATSTACTITLGDAAWTPLSCGVWPANAAAAASTTLGYTSAISAGTWTLTGSVLAPTSWYYDCR